MLFRDLRTIGRLLKLRLTKTPDHYAIGWIESNEVKSISFKEYKTTIEILVSAYQKIGISVGEKVAIIASTCKEWHFLDMATMCSRSCLVPIYPGYLSSEVEFLFNHSDSSILIVENDKQVEKVLSILPQMPKLKLLISIQELADENVKKFRNAFPYYTYKDLLTIGTEELKSNPDILDNHTEQQSPDEIASIIYTSGTTGEPKGAVITQHALCTMLMNIEMTVQGAFSSKDKTLTFLPLSHVLGRCDSLLPLVFGWQAVYAESIERLQENLALVRPTIMIAVPRIFEKIYSRIMAQINSESLLAQEGFKWATKVAEKYFSKLDQDLSPSAIELLEYHLATKLVFSKIYNRFGGRIRYFISGGAPLSAQIIKLLRCANLTVLEGYGLTETIAPCCLNPLSKQVPGTVGRPMGDVQFSFGADKEIFIKSEALMKEYYKNPEATSQVLQDGWLHSGDIGEFTSDGYLKILDRKKDIIITSGGKNVAPQKIENIAKTKPHISHMVVIGDGKNYLTALIGIEKESFLPLLQDLDLPFDSDLEEIANNSNVHALIQAEINELNEELSQFEKIKKFRILKEEFTTENFLTPSLKIKRKLITQKYQTLINEMYSS